MDVTAAEEVATVVIRRTQPLVEEAVVEGIGHVQQRLELIKSWKEIYSILAKDHPQIYYEPHTKK